MNQDQAYSPTSSAWEGLKEGHELEEGRWKRQGRSEVKGNVNIKRSEDAQGEALMLRSMKRPRKRGGTTLVRRSDGKRPSGKTGNKKMVYEEV